MQNKRGTITQTQGRVVGMQQTRGKQTSSSVAYKKYLQQSPENKIKQRLFDEGGQTRNDCKETQKDAWGRTAGIV